MSKNVYIFRGAPASGKGTIVPEFCKTLDSPLLIEQDKFRWGAHTLGREVADVTDEEHMAAYRAMVATYEQQLKQGRHPLVIEGLFTWDNTESSQGNVKELIELAGTYNYSVRSFVLRATKQVLLERNAQRPYSVPTEEFDALYNGVYATIDDTEVVIDSTELDVTQTLRVIASI
jgi:predicted kinase